jgi:hypothetical protein
MSELQRQYLYMITEMDGKGERSEAHPDSFSFIVRVWNETSDEEDDLTGWHGSVERVGQNQRFYVRRPESILEFIKEQTGMKNRRFHPLFAWWHKARRWWKMWRQHGSQD